MPVRYQPLIHGQEIGDCAPSFFRRSIIYRRLLSLSVAKKHVHCTDSVSISSMELDPIEHRYLISTGSDKNICIHDTWNLAKKTNSYRLPQIARIGNERTRFAHKKTTNFVQWYPHDTGMFVTSSFDGTIKIWDTNKLKPAETMDIKLPIYNHHMSPSSTSHFLIAAATPSHVRMADMRSGSTTHILKGHRDRVLCVRWSPRSEYCLASGSEDNKLLLWDVRHAKSVLRNFNQNSSESPSEGSGRSAGTAHTGSVNCVRFNEDGRYLLSFGTDERMRLWNSDTGENTLVNYGRIDNDSDHLPVHCTIYNGGPLSSIAFVPSGRQVLMFDLYAGHFLKRLTEHFSPVRCCELNPYTQEFYTAAQASNILMWTPEGDEPPPQSSQVMDDRPGNPVLAHEAIASLWQDEWSDND